MPLLRLPRPPPVCRNVSVVAHAKKKNSYAQPVIKQKQQIEDDEDEDEFEYDEVASGEEYDDEKDEDDEEFEYDEEVDEEETEEDEEDDDEYLDEGVYLYFNCCFLSANI
jgi:hypothetical protein